MKNNIDTILEELYAIDPSFREHEKELRTLVIKLVTLKPDTKFDQTFADQLKTQLLGVSLSTKPLSFMDRFLSATAMRYAVSGGLIAFLVFVPLTYYFVSNNNVPGAPLDSGFSFEVKTTQVKKNAFGTLTSSDQAAAAPLTNRDSASKAEDSFMQTLPEFPSFSAGGKGGGSFEESAGMAPSSGGVTSVDRSMIAPVPPEMYVNYKYVYTGDPLKLESSGIVLKRVKSIEAMSQLNTFLQKTNFNLVDLGSFTRLKLRSFELGEDKDFGYNISVNFDEGMISINPQWDKWNMNVREYKPIQSSEVPDDKTLISIADKFLREHNISTKDFGSPTVDNNWRNGYPALMEKSSVWYGPEAINVTYPLQVNGMEVYDEGGYPFGLQVSVAVREKRVWGVYNLTSQSYESSEYPLETDTKKIISLAEESPYGYYMPMMKGEEATQDQKTEELKLGSAKPVLMKFWKYDEGKNEELLVPALLFPILDRPENMAFWQKNKIVPLVKDILNNRYPVPGPVIMEKPLPVDVPPAKVEE
jgi:hypothetical protein